MRLLSSPKFGGVNLETEKVPEDVKLKVDGEAVRVAFSFEHLVAKEYDDEIYVNIKNQLV